MDNNKKVRIFFSYSSGDEEAKNKIVNFMQKEYKGKFEVIDQEKSVAGGENSFQMLIYLLRNIDVFVIFLSEISIKSNRVKFESQLSLYNYFDKKPIKILPIKVKTLDPDKIPDSLKTIGYIELDESIKDNLKNIGSAILERSNCGNYQTLQNFFYRKFGYSAELIRLQRIIQEGLNQEIKPISTKISDIVEALKAQNSIMNPKSISIDEEEAKYSIWVVTTHLYNDLYDKNIGESVVKNLSKGIKYSYFTPKSKFIEERIKIYKEEKYKGYEGKYEFEYLEKPSLMPFDEVVIYDAADDLGRWGYVQIKYNEDSLFLKLSDRNLGNFIKQLEKLIEKKGNYENKIK